MPQRKSLVKAPSRFCVHPGCSTKVTHGRCSEHQKQRQGILAGQRRATHWHNTGRWKRFSRDYRLAHPYCINYGKDPRCTVLTDVTDHINGHPPNETEEQFYAGPFQPMCLPCHSRKIVTEVGFAGVTGGS